MEKKKLSILIDADVILLFAHFKWQSYSTVSNDRSIRDCNPIARLDVFDKIQMSNRDEAMMVFSFAQKV